MNHNNQNDNRSNLSDMGRNNQIRHGYVDPNTGFVTDKGADRMTPTDHQRADEPRAPQE